MHRHRTAGVINRIHLTHEGRYARKSGPARASYLVSIAKESLSYCPPKTGILELEAGRQVEVRIAKHTPSVAVPYDNSVRPLGKVVIHPCDRLGLAVRQAKVILQIHPCVVEV